MDHCKEGGIQHAAIATLIYVGCVALKDYGNDYFFFFLQYMLICYASLCGWMQGSFGFCPTNQCTP